MREQESKKLPIAVKVAAAVFGTVAASSFLGCGSEDADLTFSGVCSKGQVVGRAADYINDDLNPIVLLNSKGEKHDWTDEVPKEWRPQSVEDTELVACLSEADWLDQVCEYVGASDVWLMRNGVHVQVREAKTGKEIVSEDFYGSDPPQACESKEPWELTKRTGSEVLFTQVWGWLKNFVELTWGVY